MQCQRAITLLIFIVLLTASKLPGRVVSVDVTSRHDTGNANYEQITGTVTFSVPVNNPHNSRIVDLDKADNLQNGEVRFTADFTALRPKDVQRSNGTLVLEIVNRGHAALVSLVDGSDAWFARHGYTVVSLGWQWDAVGDQALVLHAPIARDGARPITGLVRGDIMPSEVMQQIPLAHWTTGRIGGSEYAVADPKDPRDTLTVRDAPTAARTLLPRADWNFPDDRHIALHGGFQKGKIYEYVYVAANPVIAGLGFAAARDFASYVKHSPDAVTPAQRVVGEGISQNGRFLRDFLYQGFNADEEGRIALDGVLAHVAGAGRGSFNYRFAQPSRDAQPTSSIFFPTDIFPFTDAPETDPLTGARGGLLDRAKQDHVVPKIFFSLTSYEYWGRCAALIHVSADGTTDAPISDQVRIYHFAGLQHFSGPFPPQKGKGDLLGQQLESPLPVRYLWRGMITNMHEWLTNGTAPPTSRYPHLADHTLVSLHRYAFPHLPGVNRPHEASAAFRLDFGTDWQNGILRTQPPAVGRPFPVLVPQVNADGNEQDGVQLPEITEPLATYAPWNLRSPEIGAPDQRVAFEGSYLPFAKTAAQRRTNRDPRRSIAERYRGRADYLARYTTDTDSLIQQRWILPEDRQALLDRGSQEWNLAAQ